MYTYACVLSTNEYIDGLLVLNECLKRTKSKYKLLCIVTQYICKENLELLEAHNIEYKVRDLIIDEECHDNREKYKFNIIDIFALTEYEKVVYLDLDLLINDNIDELFEYDSISMFKNPNNDLYNTGIIVLKPDAGLYNSLIKYQKDLKGELINTVINNFIVEKNINVIELPPEYISFRKIKDNTFTYNDRIYNYSKDVFEVDILSKDYRPKIIHYLGNIKPFMKRGEYNDEFYNIYISYLNNIYIMKEKKEREKYLISIIIPIYNRQSYLTKVLESVLNQTHKNLEIILINDGSTDNSLKICKQYQKIDSRIKIINNKINKGVSYSRNKGLEVAKGDFIGFVDSDDYIEENMYDILLDDILKTGTDFSQCGRIVNNKKESVFKERYHTIYGNKEIIKQFLTGYIVTSVIWDKLFKRDKIKRIKFKENYKKNEDAMFVFDVLKNTDSFVSNNCYLYHYSWRTHNSLSYKFNLDDDWNLIEYHNNITNFVNKYYPNLNIEVCCSKMGLYIHVLNEIITFECYKNDKKKVIEFISIVKKFINEHKKYSELSAMISFCNNQIEKIENNLSTKNIKNYKHFIITYFNAYTDYIDYNNISPKKINTYKYLEQRFKIFEEMTLPSIKSQTCQNFEWIIVFNSDTPKKYKDRIKQLKKEFRFTDLYFEKGEYFNFDLYVSDKYKEYKWFLTTRLDNDDMIGKNYVDKVQKIVEKDDSKKIITFEKGLKYDYINKKYYKTNRIGNHFLSCFSTCDSNVYSYEHDSIGKNNSDILYIDSKTDKMWVEVIHDTNVINYIEPALDIPIEKVSI